MTRVEIMQLALLSIYALVAIGMLVLVCVLGYWLWNDVQTGRRR